MNEVVEFHVCPECDNTRNIEEIYSYGPCDFEKRSWSHEQRYRCSVCGYIGEFSKFARDHFL